MKLSDALPAAQYDFNNLMVISGYAEAALGCWIPRAPA
jgi:hypothetical protein